VPAADDHHPVRRTLLFRRCHHDLELVLIGLAQLIGRYMSQITMPRQIT
jgi:hypothetical protein